MTHRWENRPFESTEVDKQWSIISWLILTEILARARSSFQFNFFAENISRRKWGKIYESYLRAILYAKAQIVKYRLVSQPLVRVFQFVPIDSAYSLVLLLVHFQLPWIPINYRTLCQKFRHRWGAIFSGFYWFWCGAVRVSENFCGPSPVKYTVMTHDLTFLQNLGIKLIIKLTSLSFSSAKVTGCCPANG